MSDYKRIADFAKVKRGASPRPIYRSEMVWERRRLGSNREMSTRVEPISEGDSNRHLLFAWRNKQRKVSTRAILIMSICATLGKPGSSSICLHASTTALSIFYDIEDADVDVPVLRSQFTEDQLVAKGQPGTQVNLNTSIVGNHRVFAPPLPEQRKIARILSTVDDLIERTEALIAKYRAIKQGLMHDLLTRGVDASGRLRPPREEAPGLYRESAVGWVPREWEHQIARRSRTKQ